jgi:methylase of polypeptide subunit release factors
MQEALLSKQTAQLYSHHDIFTCPEESRFYAQCLENMVLNRCTSNDTIVEFGSGDGSPVISALYKNFFEGTIHGFELNSFAYKLAHSKIKEYQLQDRYIIHNQCFFKVLQTNASYLIANPPYLPAPDNDLYIPSLYGGIDGTTITKQLLSLGYTNIMLMVSAYSNPIEILDSAIEQGYQVIDFIVSPLKFGYYSCEPKVKNTITELRNRHQAFYSKNVYFLSGVLFKKMIKTNIDLSEEFIKVMTVL